MNGWICLLLGSTLFLAAESDPLVFSGREASVSERPATILRRDAVDFPATSLRLSPDGTRWALRRLESRGGWIVGDFAAGRRTLEASDVAFLDAHRVLALSGAGTSGDDAGSVSKTAPELRLL